MFAQMLLGLELSSAIEQKSSCILAANVFYFLQRARKLEL
jgi:hypothetical protein